MSRALRFSKSSFAKILRRILLKQENTTLNISIVVPSKKYQALKRWMCSHLYNQNIKRFLFFERTFSLQIKKKRQ